MSDLLLLDNDDIERTLSLETCMDALDRMYRAVAENRAVEGVRSQTHVPLPEPGLSYCLKTMDGALLDSGYMTLRLTSDAIDATPVDGVPRRVKLPRGPGGTWCGLIIVFAVADLAPVAILHDGYIQPLRVACTGALSARHLARADAGDLALIGTGGQAWWHLLAMQRVRPLRRVRVYSPTRERLVDFASRATAALGMPVEAMNDAESAVRGADLVVAATNVSRPILRGAWLAPGAHVISIVSGDREHPRREIDDEVVRRAARVVAHWKENAMHHRTADLAEPIAAGILGWDDVHDLADVIAGKAPGRESDSDITLFKNNGGMGLQFAAIAPAVYEQARAAGVGRRLPRAWFVERMVS